MNKLLALTKKAPLSPDLVATVVEAVVVAEDEAITAVLDEDVVEDEAADVVVPEVDLRDPTKVVLLPPKIRNKRSTVSPFAKVSH